MKVAVVGAGWAGLSAAVRATQAGHAVTVFEAAAMPGGRARSDADAAETDNGQHILLAGYTRTLALMQEVGVNLEEVLLRRPLALTYPDGSGFALPTGPLGALRGLVAARGFSWRDRLSLVRAVARWHRSGWRCEETLTVARLLQGVAAPVRTRLLEPLCVAALNTPPGQASAAVLLAVLKDSLFGAPGASELLLPRRPLARLLPTPALAWLRAQGVPVLLRHRVRGLARDGAFWAVQVDRDGTATRFDRVVLAAPATEAARLVEPVSPAWASIASGLAHEPIATVTLRAPNRRWPAPMLTLKSDEHTRPAQFAFRLESQGAKLDHVTLVASAAGDWLERGADALARAAAEQLREAFAIGPDEAVDVIALRAERRATFRCVAGVRRPPARIAEGLVAAGDHVAGRYPATLEAAVIAGETAAALL